MTRAAVSYVRLVAVHLQVRYNEVFSSKRVLKYIQYLDTEYRISRSKVDADVSDFKSRTFDCVVYLSCGFISSKHQNHFQFASTSSQVKIPQHDP